MTKLSKRAQLIRSMHNKGLTYEEIGDIFGISKQAAYQAANAGDGVRDDVIAKIKFTGLRDWMLKHRVGLAELERRCGCRLRSPLIMNGNPKKNTIDIILAVTGLTYEECFKEE